MGPGQSAADGERELLRQTVEDLLAGQCTPARVAAAAAGSGWDAGLWQALEETGLTLAGSPEEAGGSGGDLFAAADIAAAAGAAAAPVPLAETLSAGMLLARAGVAIPPGPLTVAVAARAPAAALRRVPYGRLATTVAAGGGEDGDWLAVIAPAGWGGTGRNLAGELRDEVGLGADAEVREAAGRNGGLRPAPAAPVPVAAHRGGGPADPRPDGDVREGTRAVRAAAG